MKTAGMVDGSEIAAASAVDGFAGRVTVITSSQFVDGAA